MWGGEEGGGAKPTDFLRLYSEEFRNPPRHVWSAPSPEHGDDEPTEPPTPDQTKQQTLQRKPCASDIHLMNFVYLIAFVAGLSALSSLTRGPLRRQTAQA